ncbi:MAG TPA: hypothetical protein VGA67_03095 [Candidatus Dojkabacteria bacterium]|jgi:hypothetical protein
MNVRRVLTIILIIATIGLAIGAFYISIQLGRDVAPDDSDAASQEVWDAEIPKNQQQRTAYAQGWQNILNSPNYSFELAKDYADEGGARFEPETPILSVGSETLYGRDLNYYMFLLQFPTYISSEPLTDADVDGGLNVLINHSLILQKSQEEGFLQLTPTIFNSPTKDFTKRNEAISEFLPQVSKFFIDTVEAEVITIWFNNNIVPQDTETGRQLALAKMESLFDRLTRGEITMEQAGAEIASDQQILTQVDPAAPGNSYASFTAEYGGAQPFYDVDLNNQLWSLGEGQYTNILTAQSDDPQGPFADEDIFFAIIKVNSRTLNQPYDSTEQLYTEGPDDSISKGESEILIERGGGN